MPATNPAVLRPRRSGARRLYMFAPVLVIAVGTFVIGARARVPDDEIAPGVRVGSLDLGGKTLDSARTALNQLAAESRSTPFVLHFAANTGIRRVWRTDAQQLGLQIDVPATLDAASKAGRTGVLDQVSNMIHGPAPVPIAPHVATDTDQLQSYLKRIARAVYRPAKNAKILLLRDGGFGLHHDRSGFALDKEASAAAITQAWAQLNGGTTSTSSSDSETAQPDTDPNAHAKTETPGSTDTQPPTSSSSSSEATPRAADVELSGRIIPAAITFDKLSQIDGELGSFSTSYAVGDRGDNIHLAARHINGTLLMPGEIFSYNKIVGPRDSSLGFKQAPVILHGKLQPGMGGGVCQVSSTLFNAVLLSDLKIVERTNHAFKVHYLPAGRDATVADGSLDFKFQNNTSAPIYVTGYGHGGYLHFAIFGKKTPGREVSLVQGRESIGDIPADVEHDSSLYVGHRRVVQEGHPEIRVTWYRVVRENGEVVSREPIRTHYNAIPEIVVIGTKPYAPRIKKAHPQPVRPAAAPVTPVPAPSTAPTQQKGGIRD